MELLSQAATALTASSDLNGTYSSALTLEGRKKRLGKGWTHGGKLYTLPPALELLHLLGYSALKHCLGSIIVGLQLRIRRLKGSAAAGWFVLEKV